MLRKIETGCFSRLPQRENTEGAFHAEDLKRRKASKTTVELKIGAGDLAKRH